MESMGVASGCGCKEVYRFPHITYPYSSCICSFLQQIPYFLFIFWFESHLSRSFFTGKKICSGGLLYCLALILKMFFVLVFISDN